MNIFNSLDVFGKEDFFTAVLAAFLQRNERFRDAFVAWLEPHSGIPLHDIKWRVEVQHGTPSKYGEAVLDMKLVSDDVQIWCEHKIEAPLGKRKDDQGKIEDQLEKYLDAANRVMRGVNDGREQVQWPGTTEAPRPVVLLYLITRNQQSALKSSKYAGRIAGGGRPGLVWPDSDGHLLWGDFCAAAHEALTPALQGELGEFEKTLATQFLDYWKGIPGMWKEPTNDEWDGWLKQIKTCDANYKDAFRNLKESARQIFGSGVKINKQYRGKGIGIKSIEHDVIDHISICLVGREQTQMDPAPKGKYFLQILVTPRAKAHRWDGLPSGPAIDRDGKWRVSVARAGGNQSNGAYILVEMISWEKAVNSDLRGRLVLGAFLAGLKRFSEVTGCTIKTA